MEAAVPIIPGKIVPPMTLPRGYHDSLSYQFQKAYQPSLAKNFVVLKLNHGSNSWMTDSYLITEKTRVAKAKKQIRASIITLKIGEIFLRVVNAAAAVF